MLHPSYTDLTNTVNKGVEPGKGPVVQNHYFIVTVTAKRAKQIIAGRESIAPDSGKKPLSMVMEELYESKVKIVGGEDFSEEENN